MDDENNSKTGFEGANCTWRLLSLPPIISECCDFLEKKGFDDEGIFRVTGSFRDINILKAEYSKGNSQLDLTEVSSHSVAGVLTHFFNESEEPIFPYEIYESCIECMELDNGSMQQEGIKQLLFSLPTGNFLIIKRFVHVLRECANLCEVNKMTVQNLAIALSPTMLRPKEETIETLISHGETTTQLIARIIEDYAVYFEEGPPPLAMPDTIPETFTNVLEKAREDINARLPPDWMKTHGPRLQGYEKESVAEEEKPIARLQAIWRGIQLRRKLKGVHLAYQREYNRACWDYLRRENNFVHAMKRAIRDFQTTLGDNKAGKRIRSLKALKDSNTSNWQLRNAEVEVKSIVSGFKAVIETHQMLYEGLLARWEEQWPMLHDIGELLVTKLPLFIVYNMYMEMFCRVDNLIHGEEANAELGKWMKIVAGSSQYQRTLGEVLRMPFQHIVGCTVPIQKFLNCVLTYQHDPVDTNNIVKAFAILSRLSIAVSALDLRIDYQRTLAAEQITVGLSDQQTFASLNRRLVRRGQISINKQWQYVFLFDDICVVCQQNKETYQYLETIRMKGTTVTDTSRLGFLLKTPLNAYNMLSKKPEEKVGFFVAFQQVADRWQSDRFGVPLHDLLEREGRPDGIPEVVEVLSNHLTGVERKEGNANFYCLGGEPYTVTALRNTLNSASALESVDLSKSTPPVVVDTLKQFFLELPAPLLERSKCRDLFTNRDETEIDLHRFREFIQALPTSSVRLLCHISELLANTLIHPSVLAQTWGHTIFRDTSQSVTEALQLTQVTTVIRELLLHYDALCDPELDNDYFEQAGAAPQALNEQTSLPLGELEELATPPPATMPPPPQEEEEEEQEKEADENENTKTDTMDSDTPDNPHSKKKRIASKTSPRSN